MTSPTRDTHFTGHKFRALNDNFWKNLESRCVYFAPPSKLNDPFDCQIDLMKAVRLAKYGAAEMTEKELARWQGLVEFVTGPISTCGVFSVCCGDICGNEASLLWSHYAANHQGVCITYQIPYSFVSTLVGCAPVVYDAGDLLNALRSLDLFTRPDFESRIKPVITSFLTTKAKQWSYEKESRLISEKHGSVQFESDWVRQICFGLNTSPTDKAKVIERVVQLGYIECQFAEVVHSNHGVFDLELREVQRA